MRFIGLKNCDTCRKALKALQAAGATPQVIDVRADGLDPADIGAVLARFPDRAINRASATWRGLSEADRATAPADLLAAHPTLMKRPVITDGTRWTIGWDEAAQGEWLKGQMGA